MKALKYISAITLVALAATSCVIRFDKDKMLKALEDHKKIIEDYSMFVEDSTESAEDNVEDSIEVCWQDDTVVAIRNIIGQCDARF